MPPICLKPPCLVYIFVNPHWEEALKCNTLEVQHLNGCNLPRRLRVNGLWRIIDAKSAWFGGSKEQLFWALQIQSSQPCEICEPLTWATTDWVSVVSKESFVSPRLMLTLTHLIYIAGFACLIRIAEFVSFFFGKDEGKNLKGTVRLLSNSFNQFPPGFCGNGLLLYQNFLSFLNSYGKKPMPNSISRNPNSFKVLSTPSKFTSKK